MKEVIARLSKNPHLEVVDQAKAWVIRAAKPGGMVFEITVPHDVLEWFVTIKQAPAGRKIWSDWMDYYAVKGETEAELQADMARDIERFVEQLLAATVRIIESRMFFGRKKRLEWRTTGDWQRVSIFETVAKRR